METQSEGRKVNYHINPANKMHVITVNDAQVELSTKELTDIANAALVMSDKQSTADKKGK